VYIDELGHLVDSVPPVPFAEIEGVLLEDCEVLALTGSRGVTAARPDYFAGFFAILSSARNTSLRFGRPVSVPFGSV